MKKPQNLPGSPVVQKWVRTPEVAPAESVWLKISV